MSLDILIELDLCSCKIPVSGEEFYSGNSVVINGTIQCVVEDSGPSGGGVGDVE